MDSFEWNKIFGAVLGTALFVVALNIVIGGYMAAPKNDKPGMEVVVAEGPATSEAPVAEVAPDWGTVIPVADVAAGEKVHGRCLQCHDFAKGGPNKIGPNLYGIVGGTHAHAEGFAYSTAMAALKGKTWGYDELDAFLKSPKAAVPGTKMAFAGLSKTAERVNLIAYLRTLSDAPLAIPAPKPAAAPAEPAPAAPADGTEPAGELQAPPPGGPGTTTPGSAPPAAAPGTAAPANPTTTAPTTTPAAPAATPPATPATPAPATPAPAKPAGGGH
ncbi:MAG: cytochrome c family protein [Alphaproteobacteria bacterium]|nr:cytochrome c family protein [Alphaproteobacteria bacterium]